MDISVPLGFVLGVGSATSSNVRELKEEVTLLRRELTGTREPTQAEIDAWLASPAGQEARKNIEKAVDAKMALIAFWFVLIVIVLPFLGWLLPTLFP